MEIDQLVENARTGDRAAFAELVARFQKVAISRAWRTVHDFHIAQDIAQEAFVIAHRQLAKLEKPASFGPWMLEIVRRQSLKTISRQPNLRTMENVNESHVGHHATGRQSSWQEQHALVIEAIKNRKGNRQWTCGEVHATPTT